MIIAVVASNSNIAATQLTFTSTVNVVCRKKIFFLEENEKWRIERGTKLSCYDKKDIWRIKKFFMASISLCVRGREW
jgi:hypothetical protein